jgi:hypothetical protein
MLAIFRAQSSERTISRSTGRITMILSALESSRRVDMRPTLKCIIRLSFDDVRK